MHIQLLKLFPCWAQVLPWVKCSRIIHQVLADSGCHSQSSVRVDVYLAYSRLYSLLELGLRNTYRVLEFSAVAVDDLNIFLWNRG